jgi:hypothetical protein
MLASISSARLYSTFGASALRLANIIAAAAAEAQAKKPRAAPSPIEPLQREKCWRYAGNGRW